MGYRSQPNYINRRNRSIQDWLMPWKASEEERGLTAMAAGVPSAETRREEGSGSIRGGCLVVCASSGCRPAGRGRGWMDLCGWLAGSWRLAIGLADRSSPPGRPAGLITPRKRRRERPVALRSFYTYTRRRHEAGLFFSLSFWRLAVILFSPVTTPHAGFTDLLVRSQFHKARHNIYGIG